MEMSESLPMREKDPNIDLMKNLFSENTIIKKKESDNYQVDTILDNGICDGGQKIKLDLIIILDEWKKHLIYPPVFSPPYGYDYDPFVSFKINSFLINGQEIINDEIKVYLTSQRPLCVNIKLLNESQLDDYKKKKEINDEKLFKLEEGGRSNISKKEIYLCQIKTGDDLATYAHELGHIIRNSDDLKLDKLFLSIDKMKERLFIKNKKEPTKNDISFKDEKKFREIIFEERKASLKGLDYLKKNKIFSPNDPDLLKVKLFYSAYLGICVNFYIEKILNFKEAINGEVDTIMDFDKDWHF